MQDKRASAGLYESRGDARDQTTSNDQRSLLALLTVIRIEPRGVRAYANVMLGIWVGIIVGTLIYTQVTGARGAAQES